MINRLKLYFTHYDFTDDYYISVLNEHKLNPYQKYDKNVHRIAMLECVLQIFTELARASGNNEFNSQIQSVASQQHYDEIIRCYKNDIAILKNKEHKL